MKHSWAHADVGWFVAALIVVIALYVLVRTLVYTVRLVTVVGFSGLAAVVTWWGLSEVESRLGLAWQEFFMYRWVEPFHVQVSLTKLVLSAAVGLFILWRLTNPPSSR
ncbi:MAG: hypothetical protein NZ742_09550 [Acidobacteria bacterium]|nr:hypothetical protein [Acidobacteriota bacterium]MDW7983895.1 hypothetical protein [Acidobacteriota bacterium]